MRTLHRSGRRAAIALSSAAALFVAGCAGSVDGGGGNGAETSSPVDPGVKAAGDEGDSVGGAIPASGTSSTDSASVCSGLEDCYNGSTCYRLTGVRWCQVSSGNGIHWTPVNTYNHTGWGSVNDSMHNWNFPPNGPSNTLYLYSDGVDNYNHDIDIFTVSVNDWWWGWSFYSSSGGCLVRGSAGIKLNTYRMPNTGYAHVLTEQHELGHDIGLGHACACSQVMDPCFNCGSDTLTNCDGQGAAALYH